MRVEDRGVSTAHDHEGPKVVSTALAGPRDVGLLLVAGVADGAGDAVFGAHTDLVLVVGPGGDVEYANPAAARILDTPVGELVGASVFELLHPDDVVRAFEAEARAASPSVALGVAAPFRVRHGRIGWRWLDLSSGRIGRAGAQRSVVVGRVNDDDRSHQRIIGLMLEGASVEEVVDALPGLAEWRMPQVPFAVSCRGDGPARHVTGHTAATDLLRSVVAVPGWLEALGDEVPSSGPIALLGAGPRLVGTRHRLSSWVAARVWSADGSQNALVLAATRPGGTPVRIVEERVRRVGVMARLVVEWAGQRRALEHAGCTDAVTGLANRAATLDALDAALARGASEGVAVLALDLDRFADVNRRVGHRSGDAVLAEVARRVRDAVEPGATVGRVAGDELVVVVRGAGARLAAETSAHRILDALAAPITVASTTVTCSASIGIAVVDGHHAAPSVDDLLDWSEQARGMAKAAGGGRVVVATCPDREHAPGVVAPRP